MMKKTVLTATAAVIGLSLLVTGCGSNTSAVPVPAETQVVDDNGNIVLDAAITSAIEQDVAATKQAVETWNLANPGQTPNYAELIVNSNPVFTDIQILTQGPVFTVQGYYIAGDDGKSLQLVSAVEGNIV